MASVTLCLARAAWAAAALFGLLFIHATLQERKYRATLRLGGMMLQLLTVAALLIQVDTPLSLAPVDRWTGLGRLGGTRPAVALGQPARR